MGLVMLGTHYSRNDREELGEGHLIMLPLTIWVDKNVYNAMYVLAKV